jgi:hypothetical protein
MDFINEPMNGKHCNKMIDNKEFRIKTYYIEDKHLLKNKMEMSHFCLRDVRSFFHSQNFNLQGDIDSCEGELEDLFNLFSGYHDEMIGIISPKNYSSIMQLDRVIYGGTWSPFLELVML